jgi:hypothetical protein
MDGGGTWADGGALPTRGFDIPDGMPTVCVDASGNFYAAAHYNVYLQGYTVAVWRGSFQGSSVVWGPPTVAVPPIYDWPTYDRPWITCDPERGYLFLTYTRVHESSSSPSQMTVYFTRSVDQGLTWSVPQALSNAASNGAHPAVGPDGELYVVWEDYAAQQVVGCKSIDFGASFGPSFTVAPMLDNIATPPPSWVAPNYRSNPLYNALGPANSSFPAIAVDRSHGPRRGTIYVTWAEYATGTVGEAAGTVYDPEPNNYFAQAAPFTIGQDISGYAQSADFGGADCDIYTFIGTVGQTLWITGQLTCVFPGNYDGSPVVMHYGLVCGADTTQLTGIATEPLQEGRVGSLPPLIYTFPATERYYLLLSCPTTNNYCYYLSTRLLNLAPGQAARDSRDVVLVSSNNGGAAWSAKRRVNDDPPMFDNSFPSVAVDNLGQVHLAWYDRRDDAACGAYANTYWTESLDGGVTFLPSQRVSTQSSPWNFSDLFVSTNVGDHLGFTASGNRVYTLWTDARGTDADVYGATITSDGSTAVAVSGFRAELEAASVRLAWLVSSATEITGFQLYRAEGSGPEEALGPIQRVRGDGGYQTDDASALAGHRYTYRLEILRSVGSSDWLGPVELSLPAPAARLTWEQIAPNPFDQSVQLTLALPRAGALWARIYDLQGHEVASLQRSTVGAGRRSLTWDGRDHAGRRVSPGVYLVRADLGTESTTRRVISIR